MTWIDRLQQAALTPPSGTRLTFDFEDVSKSFDKVGTAFGFSDANGTFIQQKRNTGTRYPLRVFFWGADYDKEAEAFDKALRENGTMKLEHPAYGTVNVVPFGTISQRDDLKTAANQAVIEVVFWDTIGTLYPTAQTDPSSAVVGAVDEYNDAEAGQFAEEMDLDTASDRATFKSKFSALLATTKSGLDAVADTQKNVEKEFNNINDSINSGIDILVGQPLTLAFQTVLLIQSPARALTSIQARLDAYANLANSIISGDGAGNTSNEFHTKDLYASTYVTGSILSVVNTQFETKTEALTAADSLLQQFADVIAWRDDNYQALDEIDTGAAYQQLQEAVAIAAGFLIDISFSLKQERSIVLSQPRTIVDLSAELYGEIDGRLDFLIASNNLSGDEHIELKRGREIVYYV